MNGQYTPGPWTAKGEFVTAPNEGHICVMRPIDTRAVGVDEANARLIAAAPELAEELARVLNIACGHASDGMKIRMDEAEAFPWAKRARAALEKAGVTV